MLRSFNRTTIGMLTVAVLLLSCPAIQSAAWAQSDDEDDFPPGMLARYSAAGKTIERIDPDVAFVWNTSSPDERLPEGPFTGQWSSQLLIRQEGTYQLHAYVQGKVSVSVDGQSVLNGEQSVDGWVSGGKFALGFGEKPLEITFEKTGKTARLQLFWSSDKFSLEPLPANLLFRDEASPEWNRIDHGRTLFTAHRCNRCHQREKETAAPTAPSLVSIATGLNPEWLKQKLLTPTELTPHGNMPSFGLTADEAQAITAFLWKSSKSVRLSKPSKVKDKDRAKEQRAGEVLLRSVGCLSCHRVGEHGNQEPLGGGDLSAIGEKRSAEWLYSWLSEPERLNPNHRMPVFRLSNTERRQLAGVLSKLTPNADASWSADDFRPDEKLVDQGRQLVEANRCVACHEIPGIKPATSQLADLSKPVADWNNSCLAAKPDRKKHRPAYVGIDRESIMAYVDSRTGALSPASQFMRGRTVLEQRNCLACHERDQGRGNRVLAGLMARVDDDLTGQSEGMIPPALTAIGDKLLDAALATAVSGEQKRIRLPWLRIRMPQFTHQPEDKQALLAYLIGHDRIPDGAPGSTAATPIVADSPRRQPDAQHLVLAHTLVGARGFSCVACHQVGEYVPKNVALGTRGSDLMLLDDTMRKSYFLRWTRSPLRVVPGMEMPSYQKPVAGILDENVDAQLLAIWDGLNDSRFKAPTNPAAVEQFLFVESGQPARIVRDVFTNPEENGGGHVPRAFAVGFENGHNALFDLDTFTLVQWTFGDMARQRTIGKSWYWDMAGVPVLTGFTRQSGFALHKRGTAPDALVRPKSEFGTSGRLDNYEQDGLGVRLRYTVNFELDGTPVFVNVRETLQPIPADANDVRQGWQRQIEVSSIPDGYEFLVARPQITASLGRAEINLVDSPTDVWRTVTTGQEKNELQQQFAPLKNDGSQAAGTLNYLSALQRSALDLKTKPTVPPQAVKIMSAPGFDGTQLPIDGSIMPTALTWRPDGTLAFVSLKGHVYLAHDTDGDGLEDKLTLFEEGLSAPYGIIADGDDLIVAHKPELIRLRDTDGDGRADERSVFATGWGFNDNYHDWTMGIARDSKGNLYIGLGSDYAQEKRPLEQSRWRGKVLRVSPDGDITPFSHAFRYPTGLALTADDELFATDNQGVQNCFNEINHLKLGRHFGVPSRHERDLKVEPYPAAVQVPHPWVRSVNGIFFLPTSAGVPQYAGQGVGCEYNGRLLIRFSLQKVGGEFQGATYHLTKPDFPDADANFLGPICGAVSPTGDIYVGSIHDSGWLGGLNTGSIVKLKANGQLPNGMRELRATPDGFEIHFNAAVDPQQAAQPDNYNLSGYTRVWQGGYATPDSGRYRVNVKSVDVSADKRTVTLHVDKLREGYVYEVSVGKIGSGTNTDLWPDTGHYSMNRIPAKTE